ncbi:MAG: hypothetical protein OEV40_16770, partial [Acidimicrobiia bacterium]|nr:hypothetical protein [Acidimicrobiia bacterium]
MPQPNSCERVVPTITAPARRSRRTSSASAAATSADVERYVLSEADEAPKQVPATEREGTYLAAIHEALEISLRR